MFNIRKIPLDKLNSITKYPSILTYHKLGERGCLTPELQFNFEGKVIGTEKVDGRSARLIVCPDGTVIVGSREDLLWCHRDIVHNAALGVVDSLREIANRIADKGSIYSDTVFVMYGEAYGGLYTKEDRNYTSTKKTGFRLFDAVVIPNYEDLLSWTPDQIGGWRARGGQHFLHVYDIDNIAQTYQLDTVPVLFTLEAAELPITLEATQVFLQNHAQTLCTLDEGAAGKAEGVVIRTSNRDTIAKIREEDYRRTFRIKNEVMK